MHNLDLKDFIDVTPEEEEAPNWLEIARSCIVPQGVDIPKPETLFEIDGIPIITKYELSLLIAKPKQGKSTVASYIAGTLLKQGKRILVVDTEQGRYYTSRSQSWTLRVSGYESIDNLVYLDIKKFNPHERVDMVEELLKNEIAFDLVVIDGVVDFIQDPNDQKEASNITNTLMRWAVEFNCHILSILHKNKTDTNARGAIGTSLQNKCETTLDVSLEGSQIICSPLYTRNETFPPFAFTRDSYGMPVLVSGYIAPVAEGTRKRQLKWDEISNTEHYRCLLDVFRDGWKPKRADLTIRLSNVYGKTYSVDLGDRKTKQLLDHLMSEGLIIKNGIDRSPNAFFELTHDIESMSPVDSTHDIAHDIADDINNEF